MKYWQNYKKKEKPCSEIENCFGENEFPLSEIENSFGENEFPLSEIENSFGENFDQAKTKTQIKKNFFP